MSGPRAGGARRQRWDRQHPRYLKPLKWIGTGVAGAILIALNIGAVGIGFVLFTVSPSLSTYAGWAHREMSLVVLQGVFLVIDVVGVYNWLVV